MKRRTSAVLDLFQLIWDQSFFSHLIIAVIALACFFIQPGVTPLEFMLAGVFFALFIISLHIYRAFSEMPVNHVQEDGRTAKEAHITDGMEEICRLRLFLVEGCMFTESQILTTDATASKAVDAMRIALEVYPNSKTTRMMLRYFAWIFPIKIKRFSALVEADTRRVEQELKSYITEVDGALTKCIAALNSRDLEQYELHSHLFHG